MVFLRERSLGAQEKHGSKTAVYKDLLAGLGQKRNIVDVTGIEPVTPCWCFNAPKRLARVPTRPTMRQENTRRNFTFAG